MNNLYAATKRVDITTDKQHANDSLYAKILVLKYNEKKYALISVDYICFGGGIGQLSDESFKKLKESSKKAGIDTLLCGMTHTHTEKSPMILSEDVIIEKIHAGICEALKNLECVKVGSSKGKNSEHIINRTLKLYDGSYWSVRQAHPCPPDDEIDEIPYFDDTVGVVRFDREDGSPLCVLFAYGCHPLLGYANKMPTANYPGIAEKLIEDETGAMAMMLQSCGGDVTEIDYKNYDKPKCCEEIGISLGKTVLDVLKRIKTEDAEICDSVKYVSFPRRQDFDVVREKLLTEREKLFEKLANCPLNFKAFLPLYMKYLVSPEYPLGYKYEYMMEERSGKTQLVKQDEINKRNINKYLDNLKAMEKLSKLATTLETLKWHEEYNNSYNNEDVESEVVGIKIGDTVLISAPFEPVSETGRRIRELSPFEKTFVIGYANGYMHYGSPEELYDNGGYETIECMLDKKWYPIYEAATKNIFDELSKI